MISWTVATVITLLLLYVLSLGPMIVVCKKFPIAREPVGIFYRPVIWLANHTPLGIVADPYFNFWARLANQI